MRRAVITAAGTAALLIAATPASSVNAPNLPAPSQVHSLIEQHAASVASGGPLWAIPDTRSPGGVRAVQWQAFVDRVRAPQSLGLFMFSAFLIVPDLDGDRLPDVVEVVGQSDSSGDSTKLTARRGVDGRVLWRKTTTTLDFPVPARVGPKAVSGLYLLSFGGTDAVAGFAGTLGVTALDGTGKSLWSKSFTGGAAGAVVADAALLPYPTTVAPITADGADDLVLVTQADEYALIDERHASQIEVLSGTDGSSALKVGPLVTMSGYVLPQSVDDVTGDKRADLVAVELDSGTQRGKVSLFRGADGARVWSSSPDYGEAYPYSVPDMTGDGRAELMVWTADGKTRLLNGATGATVWTRAGANVLPLGDLNGDRRSEVLLVGYERSGSGMSLALTAVDGTNRTRWSRQVVVSHSGAQVYLQPAGDLQGDGALDLFVVADYKNQSSEATRHFFVDGRTGRVLRDNLPKGEYGAGGAIDGRGDDVLVGSVTKADRALVVARSGDTHRLLWSWNGPAGVDPPDGFAYDLTGDRRADVMLFTYTEKVSFTVTVLDGRTGKQRWRT